MVLINYIVGAFKGNVKQTPLFHIEEIINKMIFIKTEKPQINNFVSITKQSVLQIAGVKCKHSVDSLLHHGEMWSGAVAVIISSGPPALNYRQRGGGGEGRMGQQGDKVTDQY